MSTQWLNIQSFQHSQNLLSAINTLSIHLKLQLSGEPDEKRQKAAAKARENLLLFLKELDKVVQKMEAKGMKPVLGIDARIRELAKNFINAKRDRHRFQSALSQGSPAEIQELIRSDKREDKQTLLAVLHELRVLLEEHVHVDTTRLLGEV